MARKQQQGAPAIERGNLRFYRALRIERYAGPVGRSPAMIGKLGSGEYQLYEGGYTKV